MHVSTLILLLASVPALVSASNDSPLLHRFSSLFTNNKLTTSLKEAEALLVPSLLQNFRRRNHQVADEIPLSDVFFHVDGDSTIELTNLRLSGVQLDELSHVSPDLKYLNMRLGLSMGSLHIKGDYSLESKSVLEVIPLANTGQISVIISDVYAEGQVGLTLGEKYLQATNFDMTYTPKNVIITVTYETNEGPAVSQVRLEALDETLIEKFRDGLWYKLNLILQKELNYLLEFSPVARLLPDKNLLQEYRNLTQGMTAIANKYIDDILEMARAYITAHNMEQVPVSNLESGFSKKILFITFRGYFTAKQGWAKDFATITRTSDISLTYDKGSLSVFGSLGLRDFKVGFDNYVAKFINIGPSGTLRANMGYNSVFIKATVHLGINSTASLDNLRVETIEDIDVKVTGLGILNWLTSKIVTWVLGFYNDNIRSVVKQQLTSPLFHILNNVNPNEYFMKLTQGKTVIANKYIDDILEKARDYATTHNLRQVPVSNFESGFSKKILFITFGGYFTAKQGWAMDLATITRTSDMSLTYKKGSLSVFGSLGLRDFKVGFDNYVAKFINIGPSGTLRANIGYNSVFIKATVHLGFHSTASLDNLQVENIEDIDVKVTGLGILNRLTSKIVTWVLGFYNDDIRSALKQQLISPLFHILNHIMNDVNPNAYFITME